MEIEDKYAGKKELEERLEKRISIYGFVFKAGFIILLSALCAGIFLQLSLWIYALAVTIDNSIVSKKIGRLA